MRYLLTFLFLILFSCAKEEPYSVLGEWNLDRLESKEDYLLPGLTFTTDTVFDDVVFFFDSLNIFTIVEGTVQPVEIIGWMYSNNYIHSYTFTDTSIFIRNIEWKVINKSVDELIIENKTEYGIVGEQLRTLYFTRK